MALTKCKECGAQVSTEAKACPSCGAQPPKKTSLLTWAVLVLILFAIFGGMCSKSDRKSSSTSPQEAAARAAKKAESDLQARQFAWVEKGKNAVLQKLKDPESAQFKDVFFYNAKAGVPVACGQVNSKNSLGGYGGFQYFISAGSPEMTYLQEEVKDFEVLWGKLCYGEEKE